MGIELAEKFSEQVEELFVAESRMAELTNTEYNFAGAHYVHIYKISTAPMNDYDRNGTSGKRSRYGDALDLEATTQEFIMQKDRSFTFVIDRMDADETNLALVAGEALARQIREVVIPEVDKYTYGVMCAGAGIKPKAIELTSENIYEEIIKGMECLDNAEVPEEDRVLLVTPATYHLMKLCKDIVMETAIGSDMRIKGVIANLDGCKVIKAPANRLPKGFGFLIAHPQATVAPTKLASYMTHMDPPGYSGTLVEGRIVYDACVLDNKKNGIYYQEKI